MKLTLIPPPMLFSSTWAALLKLLLVWVSWRSRMLCSQWWIGYWYSAGPAAPSSQEHDGAALPWPAVLGHTQPPVQTNSETTATLTQPRVTELPLAWPSTQREGIQLHWLSWHWAALSGKKKFTACSGWQTQNSWKNYTYCLKSRSKIHLISVCTLSGL